MRKLIYFLFLPLHIQIAYTQMHCLCTLKSEQPAPNYYDTLNIYLNQFNSNLTVSSSSDESELRKTYLYLSRRLHPDKNAMPNATEQFQEINHMYETLKDPERRHTYDTFLQSTQQQSFFFKLFRCFCFGFSFLERCEGKIN